MPYMVDLFTAFLFYYLFNKECKFKMLFVSELSILGKTNFKNSLTPIF